MSSKRLPELEGILKLFYPLFDSGGWVENEFEETREINYEIECDINVSLLFLGDSKSSIQYGINKFLGKSKSHIKQLF